MTRSPATHTKRHPRRQYVVDTRAQVGTALRILLPVAAVSLMSVAAVLLFLKRNDAILLHVADLQRFLLIANGVYFLLLVSVLIVVSLLLTHRWAGPAFVLKRALDRMREGDLDQRLSLRSTDYLQDVAGGLAALRDDLVREKKDRDEALQRLASALGEGDTAAAARIVSGLRGTPASPARPSRENVASHSA